MSERFKSETLRRVVLEPQYRCPSCYAPYWASSKVCAEGHEPTQVRPWQEVEEVEDPNAMETVRARLTAEQVRLAPPRPTPEPPGYITVGELRARLADVDENMLVVLAKDEDGIYDSPLGDAGPALYVAHTPYQGDAYSLDDPTAPRGAVDVILLVRTN